MQNMALKAVNITISIHLNRNECYILYNFGPIFSSRLWHYKIRIFQRALYHYNQYPIHGSYMYSNFGWKTAFNFSKFSPFHFFLATKLQEDILTYWREHQGFNAVKLIKDASLYNQKTENNTVSGAYYLNINGNNGFLCDFARTLDQHAANLLCLSSGHSKAVEGNGTGWFHQGFF